MNYVLQFGQISNSSYKSSDDNLIAVCKLSHNFSLCAFHPDIAVNGLRESKDPSLPARFAQVLIRLVSITELPIGVLQ